MLQNNCVDGIQENFDFCYLNYIYDSGVFGQQPVFLKINNYKIITYFLILNNIK